MAAKPLALLMVLAAASGPVGCRSRRASTGDGAAPRAGAGGGKVVPRYDLSTVTVARIKSVGVGLRYEVGFTRDDAKPGYHEQFVDLGWNDGKTSLLVTLWDFGRGREGETLAHRVGAVQALSVYTSQPKNLEPRSYLERFLAGTSVDEISVADVKRAIARSGLTLDFCEDEESTYAYQSKSDDYFETAFWTKDAQEHELYLQLVTYKKAVKQPTLPTQVITDADRVLIVTSVDERRWSGRAFVKALLGDSTAPPH
jgi:hypothetical protein